MLSVGETFSTFALFNDLRPQVWCLWGFLESSGDSLSRIVPVFCARLGDFGVSGDKSLKDPICDGIQFPESA